MSNFVQLFLNEGIFQENQILSPSSVVRMETPESSLKAENGLTFGYGKGLMARMEKGYVFRGHTGHYAGFVSDFGYSRSLDIGYAILVNHLGRNQAIKEIKTELLSHIPNDSSSISEPISVIPITNISNLTGCYQPFTIEIQLFEFLMRLIDTQCMIEKNGQLHQQSIIGDTLPLIHMGNNKFRKVGDKANSSIFVENSRGEVQWIEGYAYEKTPAWWAHTQFYLALLSVILIFISFLILLIRIPVRLVRKKKKDIRFLMLPFATISSLFFMFISFFTLYDTEELYSTGAILFFLFGIVFLLLSYYGLFEVIRKSSQKIEFGKFTKMLVTLTLLLCCLISSYLLYWNIIGLTLWSY